MLIRSLSKDFLARDSSNYGLGLGLGLGEDGHCKMAALDVLLFERFITFFVFLCISTCIQRIKMFKEHTQVII